MEKSGWLDVVLAPLTWLERSRGWKRRGLVVLYLLVGLTVGVLGWRELSLWRLPNLPEPFDVVKFGRVEVPDADNAMVAYRAIFSRLGDLESRGYDASPKAWNVTDWAAADPEVRRWAEDHRADLLAWLPATDRRDSLLVQPESMQISTILGPPQMLQSFGRLALLEGSRLEQAGDLEGAWRMFRAVLRASRHAGRHGGAMQRLIGSVMLKRARPRVDAWAEDPKVTTALLHRAIADVEECEAMTSPTSDMIRAEYFSTREALTRPENWGEMTDWGPYSRTTWYNHISGVRWSYNFLRREPERSGRVLRLLVAGHLAQCDRPRALRPRLLFPDFMIYDHDSRTPPAVRSIAPEELNAWAKASAIEAIGTFNNQLQTLIDAEPATFDHFRLRMAERAFELDHGRPPKTYGDLLGPYLKALPEGFEPGDLATPGAG